MKRPCGPVSLVCRCCIVCCLLEKDGVCVLAVWKMHVCCEKEEVYGIREDVVGNVVVLCCQGEMCCRELPCSLQVKLAAVF